MEVGVLFLQALNHFQRYAYVRQAHAKERKMQAEQQQHEMRPENPYFSSRMHSSSVVGNGAF